MNKIFERIIKEFQKVGDIQFSNFTKPLISVEDAIRVVEQIAEKYGKDVSKEPWIVDRPPEESGYYLVTYHKWSDGNYLPKFDDTYVTRMHYQDSKQYVGWNYPRYIDKQAAADVHQEVLAWQLLPEIYHPDK